MGLSLKARLLWPLSLLLLVLGIHQLIKHRERGHPGLNLPHLHGSQQAFTKPLVLGMQSGSHVHILHWIVETCHRTGQAVLDVLENTQQLGKQQLAGRQLLELSEIKLGNWVAEFAAGFTAGFYFQGRNRTAATGAQQHHQGQQHEDIGQPLGNQGIHARLVAVLPAARPFLMGEWHSVLLGSGVSSQEQQEQHSQQGDVDAEQMWQHLNSKVGWDADEVQQQQHQGQQGEEVRQSRGEQGIHAQEAGLQGEQRARPLALLVTLLLVGGAVLVLGALLVGARQVLLQQYQQGRAAASMEAAAVLAEAREQGRAAVAHAEKQASLVAVHRATQLQQDKELQRQHADIRELKEELAKVETGMCLQRLSQSAVAPHELKTMTMYVR
ncbi:hypothetical protein DUNSADRAFT_3828 [Dunaliella salina]|uniref:Uncharacterized protein n=1 Tax=Dunaliella salina TaxID=3046 RepID=A0ABQ7GT73_DUNSA|nr:hypothetical protein DUNSADRAFT_3828 [Dunaliella salina]|eukprot:KAF5837812.1 hypothetical protein DUNSADRAFT_3828 [Dunaliella salina]